MALTTDNKTEGLARFHPLIREWFRGQFGTPTDVQARAWPVVADGDHALITAPTGSGKTLTAFLWTLDRLLTGAWPTGATSVLYISPLKALNNDIERNLREPLRELTALFSEHGITVPEISVVVRSGDTPEDVRRRMVRKPPEILITTPESLNLIHTSPLARNMLHGIRTVILDEIHAVAHTKRGAHLMTAVERLHLLNDDFQRIALSATVTPLERMAEYVGGYALVGDGEYRKRPVQIVQSRTPKRYELQVAYPPMRAESPDDGGRWPALGEAIRAIIAQNKSTLVFTNTRRHSERISLELNKDADRLVAYAHHGSLSREVRAVVEQRMKDGELPATVATSSLELGIDIGDLDETVLVQTPFSVAATTQRVGRAGHQVGATSRSTLFPLHGRDLLEAAVMVRAVCEGALEGLHPVRNPLDVLAQVILSMTSVEEWRVDQLYDFLRTTWSYHDLPRGSFDRVVQMLAGRFADTKIRALQPMATFDQVNGTITARKGARSLIYRSGGTIPDRGLYNLRLKDGLTKIGELDEEFVWERHLGEVFPLGNAYWKIQHITHNDVVVTPAQDSPNVVPFWKADQISRGFHFSELTGHFLARAEERLDSPSFREELRQNHGMTEEAADALTDYLKRQREATGAPLPHRHHLLVERCTDGRRDKEQIQYILHTIWGGAVNRPLATALAQAWETRHGGHVEVFADNDSVIFVAPDADAEFDFLGLLEGQSIETLLRQRLEQSGLFGARFRENAARALLLPRQGFKQRMPLWMTRVRSKKLFDAVLRYEDFPILAETWRTCLRDEFDLPQLQSLLEEVRSGRIAQSFIDTTEPSPFAGGILWGQTNKYMYADDAPLRPGVSSLSDQVIQDAIHTPEVRPQIPRRIADELESKLKRTHPGYAPSSIVELAEWTFDRVVILDDEWRTLLDAMCRDNELDRGTIDREAARYVVERDGRRIHVNRVDQLNALDDATDEMSEEIDVGAELIEQWLQFHGPIGRATIDRAFPKRNARLDRVLETLHDGNRIVRGALIEDESQSAICHVDVFEILLRLKRRAQRPVVQAMPLNALPQFLAKRHGCTDDAPVALADIADRLAGYPLPIAALETDILPARKRDYRPEDLDAFFRDHHARWIGCGKDRISLVHAEDTDLVQMPRETDEDWTHLFPSAMGRYTFGELLDHTGLSSEELTAELWRGVWEGVVTNDLYAPLRKGRSTGYRPASSVPKRRRSTRGGFGRWKASRPFEGHWMLVTFEDEWDELDRLEAAKQRVRILMDRYGIVCRALLQHELPPFRWSAVFRALRVMELSSEIVAGLFVEEMPGPQFTSPDVLEAMGQPLEGDAVYWLCAADPISLCGSAVPELKETLPKRLKSSHLVYHGPNVVLESYANGKRLAIHCAPDNPALNRCFMLFDHLLKRAWKPLKAIRIEEINGEKATTSPYLEALRERFDVERDPKYVNVYPKRTDASN